MISATGLSKTYRLGNDVIGAVSDVSVSVARGEFVAVLGRSGSGKSTLLNLLGLLDRADAGRYLLNGCDVGRLGTDARAAVRNRDVGFVFQLPILLARANAVENVALPLVYAGTGQAERLRRAGAALDRVGLGHRKDHRPNQLSGGEQQRVVIARAIVNDPALILADEPTGALDARTGNEILSLLEALHGEGRTIVVVTHAVDVAARTGRRITLADGRIVSDDAQPRGRPAAAIAIAAYRR